MLKRAAKIDAIKGPTYGMIFNIAHKNAIIKEFFPENKIIQELTKNI